MSQLKMSLRVPIISSLQQLMQFKIWILIGFALVLSSESDPLLDHHIIPVHGNATLGYYYINLYIGTPPQEQSVIIDTGSGQLAIPCSQCVSCGRSHLHKPLDIRRSSTNKIITCNSGQSICQESCSQKNTNPCTFLISYAEGSSLSGILIEDSIQFQSDSKGQSITTGFGCTTKETNLFYSQAANGIFGLAPQRKARLLDLLYEKHSKFTKEDFLFSICLSKNGGIFAIGRVSEDLISGVESCKITFNPSQNLYSLNNVEKIAINNTIIFENQDLGHYGIFIDSGSTFTYFPHRQYKLFMQQIQNSCAYQGEKCKIAKRVGLTCLKVQVDPNQTVKQTLMTMFPTLDIRINGKVLSWQPSHYFLLRNRNSGQVCLGLQPLDRFLLGANWMVDRNIVFNLRQQTVEIFSGIKCSNGSAHDEIASYSDQNPSVLNYASAALNLNEDFLVKFGMLIVIILIMVALLILVGVICSKPYPSQKDQQKFKQTIDQVSQEHDSIAETSQRQISSNISKINSRIQLHDQEEDKLPVFVQQQ